jgi:nucleoside-diphosphate-sugar epimerase
MHALVTGSSGTIGTRLCETLLARGDTLTGVDWVPNKWQPSIQTMTYMADLRHWEEVQKIPLQPKPDVLIHLAANARVYELVEDPTRARDNFVTLFHALEFARVNGIKKFVFASSREGYGNIQVDVYKEDMVRVENCESPYTASKVGGEALVHAYARCYDLETIIYRFSNVYGMYDDSNRVIPLFIRQARVDQTLTIFGREKCLDFTYIDDTVRGILQGVDQFDKARGKTLNLAFGQGTTLEHLAERVRDLLHSQSQIAYAASRRGEVRRYIADISAAKSLIGYNPQTSFAQGIEKTVAWYSEHMPA